MQTKGNFIKYSPCNIQKYQSSESHGKIERVILSEGNQRHNKMKHDPELYPFVITNII